MTTYYAEFTQTSSVLFEVEAESPEHAQDRIEQYFEHYGEFVAMALNNADVSEELATPTTDDPHIEPDFILD